MANWRSLEALYGAAWMQLAKQRIIHTMIALFVIGLMLGLAVMGVLASWYYESL